MLKENSHPSRARDVTRLIPVERLQQEHRIAAFSATADWIDSCGALSVSERRASPRKASPLKDYNSTVTPARRRVNRSNFHRANNAHDASCSPSENPLARLRRAQQTGVFSGQLLTRNTESVDGVSSLPRSSTASLLSHDVSPHFSSVAAACSSIEPSAHEHHHSRARRRVLSHLHEWSGAIRERMSRSSTSSSQRSSLRSSFASRRGSSLFSSRRGSTEGVASTSDAQYIITAQQPAQVDLAAAARQAAALAGRGSRSAKFKRGERRSLLKLSWND